MDDQSDVAAHANRPEILVPRLVELVKAHAGVSRVELQVERRGFSDLLFLPGQPGEAVGEGVGDEEVHG